MECPQGGPKSDMHYLLYDYRSMKSERLFPTLLMVLDICAAAGYVHCGDWRKVIYWLAAATLTAVVTY